MHRVLSCLLILLIVFTTISSNAKSKKEREKHWQEKRLTDTPVLMDLHRFLPIWFDAHSCERGYREEQNFVCENGRDKEYVYFTHRYYYGKKGRLKIKVLLTDLEQVNFNYWNACSITDSFFKISVPEEHLRTLSRSSSSTIRQSFSYIERTNSIQYRFQLKIRGTPRIANRKTCATYSFDNGSFSGLE